MIKRYIDRLISGDFFRKEERGEDPLGKRGEVIACRFLKESGYKILSKNFRSRFGEIDLVVRDADTVCFVEVKSRSSEGYGLPEEFVDKRKQDKLIKTALFYIQKKNLGLCGLRFDVVSVNLKKNSCHLIKNAFQANF